MELKNEIIEPPTPVFNKSLRTEIVPNNLKLSNIIVIFKKAKNQTPRTIDKFVLVGKLLESITQGRIVEHLERNNLKMANIVLENVTYV